MYHAPKALYAWQLTNPQGQFKGLPSIHFKHKDFPEYIIAFGPYIYETLKQIAHFNKKGIHTGGRG